MNQISDLNYDLNQANKISTLIFLTLIVINDLVYLIFKF